MNKKTLISLIVASTLSTSITAAELPQAGTYNVGGQVSFGNIDHNSFNNDDDGIAQVLLFVDYYIKPGWAVELGINKGSNVKDWICENDDINTDDDYCLNDNESNTNSFESDLDLINYIIAVRFDTQLSENNFLYGKLGAQYFDYEMTNNNHVFEEDTGTGIYSELGWQYQWSNNINLNVGYQYVSMSKLTTSAFAIGVGYRF
jgi:opacity protein-like surface antigen